MDFMVGDLVTHRSGYFTYDDGYYGWDRLSNKGEVGTVVKVERWKVEVEWPFWDDFEEGVFSSFCSPRGLVLVTERPPLEKQQKIKLAPPWTLARRLWLSFRHGRVRQGEGGHGE